MPIFRFQSVHIVWLLAIFFIIDCGSAFAISKCQDASGKWHYGDNAAAACGDTRITIIDKRGRKIDEVAPPMTEEEINAKKAEEERIKAEQKLKAERDLEKKRILAIYPREEDIISARDSRLSGMDKNIKMQERLLDDMRLEMKKLEAKEIPNNEKDRAKLESRKETQQQDINEFYQSITRLRREREKTAEKYEKILTDFRELTAE